MLLLAQDAPRVLHKKHVVGLPMNVCRTFDDGACTEADAC
jgi:hypothetical protein